MKELPLAQELYDLQSEGLQEQELANVSIWSHELIAKQLIEEDNRHLVWKDDDLILGYVFYSYIDFQVEILHLAVRRKGCGAGQKLIEFFFDHLDTLNLGKVDVLLELKSKNLRAFNLYKRLGFRQTGHRRHYYSNGDDAILMSKKYSSKL